METDLIRYTRGPTYGLMSMYSNCCALHCKFKWVWNNKAKPHIISSAMLNHLARGSDSAVSFMMIHERGNLTTRGKATYNIILLLIKLDCSFIAGHLIFPISFYSFFL